VQIPIHCAIHFRHLIKFCSGQSTALRLKSKQNVVFALAREVGRSENKEKTPAHQRVFPRKNIEAILGIFACWLGLVLAVLCALKLIVF
jgi:hypothetical protein